MNEMTAVNRIAAIKHAEVLSVRGAGVPGAGLAQLAPVVLGSYGYWLIGVGVAVHGLALSAKHRLAREQRVQPYQGD